MPKEVLTVEQLLNRKRASLGLELLTDNRGLDRVIDRPDISSPGLVLTGFTERFPSDRIQVLGETEIAFLQSLDDERRHAALDLFLSFEIPVVFVTKGQTVPPPLLEIANERGIPVVRTLLKTAEFYNRIKPFLEDHFAPTTTVHGSLADVYGVGLLFIGKSGIGKSEAVLDLVERGHRLVADDVVIVSRRGTEILIGRGVELQRHHMEIRGVGIIDIATLFGIRSIRLQKRIEVIVQLEAWDENAHYDRTGLDMAEVDILGVPVPKVVVPLNPGKNITVIAEVVALNHLLKYTGVDTATLFNERLRRHMEEAAEYLEKIMSEEAVRGLIVAHSSLAAGLAAAVHQIAGVGDEALRTISNEGRGPEGLISAMREAVGDAPVILFTDLGSGSCALAARKISLERPGTGIVSGVNLPVLLDFVFHRELPLPALVDRLVEKGRGGISGAYSEESARVDRAVSR